MNKNVKKQDSIKRNFKPVGGIKKIEQGKTLTDGEKVDCGRDMRAKKGVNPPVITKQGVVYFNFLSLVPLLVKERLRGRSLILFFVVAGYGSTGCSTYEIMKHVYGYDGLELRRLTNSSLSILAKYGLIDRIGKKVFLSSRGLSLLKGVSV